MGRCFDKGKIKERTIFGTFTPDSLGGVMKLLSNDGSCFIAAARRQVVLNFGGDFQRKFTVDRVFKPEQQYKLLPFDVDSRVVIVSVKMTRLAGVAFCFVLFLALANCRSFEDIVNKRGLKRLNSCTVYQTGTDWYGNDLNQEPITGIRFASSCCDECNTRYPSTIRAFIFRTDLGHCYCKSAATNEQDCAVCQGSNDYGPPATCSYTENGVDSYGYDLRGPIDAWYAEDCCYHCRRWGPRCVAWVFRSDYNRCYLKSQEVGHTECENCVFGRR